MTTHHPRLLHDLPTSLGAEHVDELLRRPNLRIERIVSTGQAHAETFWYDQTEHEWVIVLGGRAKLRYERDETVVELGPGDAAFIPAHTRHQVAWTTPDELSRTGRSLKARPAPQVAARPATGWGIAFDRPSTVTKSRFFSG